MDTVFWLALLRERDPYGDHATRWKYWIAERQIRLVTTEMALWEVLNGLASTATRTRAAEMYRQCHGDGGIDVVAFPALPIPNAFQLYESRPDKAWSLTDCLSFVVMQERQIADALTADRHFEQAGFRALLLQEPPS